MQIPYICVCLNIITRRTPFSVQVGWGGSATHRLNAKNLLRLAQNEHRIIGESWVFLWGQGSTCSSQAPNDSLEGIWAIWEKISLFHCPQMKSSTWQDQQTYSIFDLLFIAFSYEMYPFDKPAHKGMRCNCFLLHRELYKSCVTQELMLKRNLWHWEENFSFPLPSDEQMDTNLSAVLLSIHKKKLPFTNLFTREWGVIATCFTGNCTKTYLTCDPQTQKVMLKRNLCHKGGEYLLFPLLSDKKEHWNKSKHQLNC